MKRAYLVAGAVLALLLCAAVALAMGNPPGAGQAATAAPPVPANTALAFVRGAAAPSVWLASSDGRGARRLGPGETPLVSPSGAYVAASSIASRGSALVLYGVGGYAVRHPFFDVATTTATPLAWSPDSRYLAVELLGTSVDPVVGSGIAVIDTRAMTARMLATGVAYGASFDPGGSDRLVYGVAPGLETAAPVDLHEVGPDGSAPRAVTHDGRSLYPVWGARGIAFDRERLRGRNQAPAYQVWLVRGRTARQLTHVKVPGLLDGLVPIAVSAHGNRLLAEYEGQDVSSAYTIQLSPLRVREVRAGRLPAQGAAISSAGDSLLVDVGGFEQAPSRGNVERIPFGGGAAVELTRGAQPSWNR